MLGFVRPKARAGNRWWSKRDRMSKSKPPPDPFRWFDSSPEVIRLVVMMYVRYPLSLRNFEDLLFERGIDICHENVRLWWNRFGPMFASRIRRAAGIAHVRVQALAMAPRRGLREDQWRDAVSMARG